MIAYCWISCKCLCGQRYIWQDPARRLSKQVSGVILKPESQISRLLALWHFNIKLSFPFTLNPKDITHKLSNLMWNDWHHEVRKAAAQTLGRTGHGKEVHDDLRDRLLEGNERDRIDALHKIAHLGKFEGHRSSRSGLWPIWQEKMDLNFKLLFFADSFKLKPSCIAWNKKTILSGRELKIKNSKPSEFLYLMTSINQYVCDIHVCTEWNVFLVKKKFFRQKSA